MPNFEKVWDKESLRATEGDSNIYYYALQKDKMLCCIGDREVKPTILLFVLKVKEMLLFISKINGQFICFENNEIHDDEKFYVKAIFNERKKRLLVKSSYGQFICSEDDTPSEGILFIVFEKNMHFSESILYNPKMSSEPAFILDDKDNLSTIIMSHISKMHEQAIDAVNMVINNKDL
jgi:hypothetical protein